MQYDTVFQRRLTISATVFFSLVLDSHSQWLSLFNFNSAGRGTYLSFCLVSEKVIFCFRWKTWLLECEIFLHRIEPDDSGPPWMEAFRNEWDGFHCFTHSVIHMTLCPPTPTFLSFSIAVPFRHMYTHTQRSPPDCLATTMCAVTTFWKVT